MSMEEYLFNNILIQRNGLILNVKFFGSFGKSTRSLMMDLVLGPQLFYTVLEKATYPVGTLGQ